MKCWRRTKRGLIENGVPVHITSGNDLAGANQFLNGAYYRGREKFHTAALWSSDASYAGEHYDKCYRRRLSARVCFGVKTHIALLICVDV